MTFHIAYTQCPEGGGGSDDFPVRTVREASAHFLRIKGQMRQNNDNRSQAHFLKVASVEKDDEGALVKTYESYESDCTHTRP